MREEAAQWLSQAEHDLRTARLLLKNEVFDTCAFISFQSAEKALKALHFDVKNDFPPKTHELMALAKAVGASQLMDSLKELNPHFVQSRYPDAANAAPHRVYTRSMAERCVKIAEEVLRWCKSKLH